VNRGFAIVLTFLQYESAELAILLYAVGVSEFNLDSIKVIILLLLL